MRILHLLDLSAPMIAGYASRSRAIVNGQRSIGLEPVVLTSVRHKNVSGAESEEIDGIRHYRTHAGSSGPKVGGRRARLETDCPAVRLGLRSGLGKIPAASRGMTR